MRAIHGSMAAVCLVVMGITVLGLRSTMAPAFGQEKKPTAPEPLQDWSSFNRSFAKEMGGFLRIDSDKVITTKKAYTGPAEITVVAKTDQDNIRLGGFNGSSVIFNGEAFPGELRIIRPDAKRIGQAGSLAISKQYPLKPNTWYRLRWKMTEDWMEVAVNDTIVFAEQRKFTLSSPALIRVGSAFGTIVDVKAIQVIPIPGSRVLLEDAGAVNAVLVASEGDSVMTVGEKGLLVWDTDNKVTRTLINKDFRNTSLRMSQDGKRLVTSNDSGAEVWDLSLGKAIRSSKKTGRLVPVGWCSPNGKHVVFLNRTDLSIVDLDTDKAIDIPQPKSDRSHFKFTPDGTRVVFVGQGELREIDLASGKEVRSYDVGAVFPQIAYSPDGLLLASVVWESMRIWDTKTGKEITSLKVDEWAPTRLEFSPDGKFIATASRDGRVIVWDTASWKKKFQTVNKSTDGIALSRNGKIAIRVASEQRFVVHDIAKEKELITFTCDLGMNSMAFSQSGDRLLIGTHFGLLVVPIPSPPSEEFVVDSGPKKLLASAIMGNDKMAVSLGFSPDGKRMVGWCGDSIQVWEVATKKTLTTIKFPRTGDDDFSGLGNAFFSPDAKQIASDLRSIKLWDSETGIEIRNFDGNYLNLAFRPDGKWIAGVDTNHDVVCWDLRTGKDVCVFRAKRNTSSVAFSSDGKMLAAGGINFVKVWDVETEKELFSVELKLGLVRKVAFSPNGKIIAAAMMGQARGFVTLWDVATGKAIHTMKCSTQRMDDLAFSPDGKWIVSVGSGETLPGESAAQVWDTGTGRLKYLLDTGPTNRYSVAISPVITEADKSAAFLGVATGPIDGGVAVTGILPDSPAEKVGLKVGDKIARVADDSVTVENFVQTLVKYKAGDVVLLAVERDRNQIPLKVALGPRPGGRLVALGGVGSPIRLLMVPE